MRSFVSHYHDRPHEGLALFTPADVFTGWVSEVAARRQHALDTHYAAHPQRYHRHAPTSRRAHINPDLALDARHLFDTSGSLRTVPTPLDTSLPEVVT